MQNVKLYRETDIKTAGPLRLVVMLYDEVMKQLDLVQETFNSSDKQYEVINNAIGKAQDIITELLVSLDLEQGGEIAQNLSRLYFYFNRVLGEANVKKENSTELQTVHRLLGELRSAWSQIAEKTMDVRVSSNSQSSVDISG